MPADLGASGRRLLAALIIDNLGSGLFLPLTVVFVVRSVGLSVGLAGTLLTVGTLAGLCAPAAVGRASDRIGPRLVVIASMLMQAAGMACYLLARGPGLVVIAAAFVAAGTQTFYSGLFALISDVAEAGPKDRPFASVTMARAAAFGAGNLLAALLLAIMGTSVLRPAASIDCLSFLAAAIVLLRGIPSTFRARPVASTDAHAERVRVMQDRPFVILIVAIGLLALATDFLLVGLPAYAIEVVRTAAWVPSVCIAMLTAATSTLSGRVLRYTGKRRRTSALAAAGYCFIAWCAVTACAVLVPHSWAAPWLLASTVPVIAGNLVAGTRANAIAEAAAPPGFRGRYLAAFQYSFTVAGLLAPLVVASFALASWVPWLLVAVSVAVGIGTLPWLARALPAKAVELQATATATEDITVALIGRGSSTAEWVRSESHRVDEL